MNDILNPYIAGAPVAEASMFFGREDVFGWIERSLEGKFVDHILVLHGQRRVGKTSVLKQIPNFLPDKYIQVFFDLQGRTGTTLDRFLWWLASEIVRTLKREHDILIPKPDRKAFEDTEYLINEFLPGIRSTLGDRVLLLTFDEFDSLDRPEIQETLSHPLIAYLRRLIEVEGLNFIFSIGSSGNKLENMQASYTDFFKSALYRKISFLTSDDTRRLVTKPVEGLIQYDNEAVQRIGEITSGHPYFTQLMCHELFSLCQKTGARTINVDDVESVLGDVVERGTVNLKFVWDEASNLEKWILATLAQKDGGDSQNLALALAEQRVRFSESDLNSALIHLRDKDILREDNRFVIHLMRLWLVANRPTDRVREELEEVNPIANRFIEIGDEYRDRGDSQQALEYYQQALNVNPGDLKAQSSIARVYLEQKDYEGAVQAFESALTIDKEDVIARTGYCEASLALGEQARAQKEYEEAIRYYQQVLEIDPHHKDARDQLAKIQKIVGDYNAAQQALREEQYAKAVELLQGIVVLDPTYKATTRLLTEAVEARKGVPIWRRSWFLPGVGTLALLVLGILFGPRAWTVISTAVANRPVATIELPVSAASTSTQETSAESNATEPPDPRTDGSIPEIEAERLVYKAKRFDGTPVTSIRWSSSGTFIAVTTLQHWVDIYDISRKLFRNDFETSWNTKVQTVDWFPGDQWITFGGGSGQIATYDYTVGYRPGAVPDAIAFLTNLEGEGEITDLQYTNNGSNLIAGTDQGYVATWRVSPNSMEVINQEHVDSGQVYAVKWNPDGSFYLTVSQNKGLQIWRLYEGLQDQLDYTSNSADWSPDGSYIAIEDHISADGYSDLEIITLDGKPIASSHQSESIINDVAWFPDGTLIATAGGDGRVLLWTGFENGILEPILQFTLGTPVKEVSWSPDGTMLAAGDANGYIWVWNLEGLEFSVPTTSIATLTHTPRPTATNTPTPGWVTDFVEPMLERINNVTPDFSEDFSNSGSGWELIDGADESFQIEAGVARLSVNKEGSSHFRNETVDSLTYRDFIMEMDARIVEGEAAIDLWTHFIFNEDPSESRNLGFLGLPAESTWSVTMDSDQGRDTQEGTGNISPVGEYTHITIILTDQKVAFSLNGNPVAYFEDPFLDEPGNFHFNCDGWSTGGVCEFDNIKIWKLP